MHRRALLATVGTTLATAGCLSDSGSQGDDSQTTAPGTDPTDTTAPGTTDPEAVPFTDAVTVGGTTLRFSGPAVQHSYFRLTTADSMAVTEADGQFFFVGVTVESGSAPDPEVGAFDLVVGDETYSLAAELGDRGPYSVPVAARSGHAFDREDGAGWVAADIPAPIDEADPWLRVSAGGEMRMVTLPGRVANELGEPAPEFAFGAVSAPDSVAPDEPIRVEVSVTNEGEGPGTARAVVNESGPMYAPHRLEASLAPGESATLSESITTHIDYGSGTDQVRFNVVAPGIESRHTVAIEESS